MSNEPYTSESQCSAISLGSPAPEYFSFPQKPSAFGLSREPSTASLCESDYPPSPPTCFDELAPEIRADMIASSGYYQYYSQTTVGQDERKSSAAEDTPSTRSFTESESGYETAEPEDEDPSDTPLRSPAVLATGGAMAHELARGRERLGPFHWIDPPSEHDYESVSLEILLVQRRADDYDSSDLEDNEGSCSEYSESQVSDGGSQTSYSFSQEDSDSGYASSFSQGLDDASTTVPSTPTINPLQRGLSRTLSIESSWSQLSSSSQSTLRGLQRESSVASISGSSDLSYSQNYDQSSQLTLHGLRRESSVASVSGSSDLSYSQNYDREETPLIEEDWRDPMQDYNYSLSQIKY